MCVSERNIKTRLSSAFLIVRRQRRRLLTASQRESKEITKKQAFYFAPGSFLPFPLHSGRDSCSLTDVICLFHLAAEQEDQHRTPPVLPRLDLVQNTHLWFRFVCLFGFFWRGGEVVSCSSAPLVQNNRLLFRGRGWWELFGVSIKPV